MVETRSMKRKPLSRPLPNSINSDLPTDLCRDILSRLPVKSLLRFRSVSKTWHSIIADPEFAKSHKYLPGSKIYLLRLVSGRMECVIRSSQTFEVIGSEQETVRIQECFPAYSLVGSDHGLFLFEILEQLLLWNPIIRRFRMLPRTPPEVERLMAMDIGLGFDPSIKDYKHVRLVLQGSLVLVYTLGTNSWKTIPFKSRDDSMPCCYYILEAGKSVCFRGSLYWLTYQFHGTTKTQQMASFDLDTEEFSSAGLPKVEDDLYDHQRWVWNLKCASDGSSLVLVRTRRKRGTIWWAQGEGGDVTWSKRYEFGSAMSIRDVLNVDVGDGGRVEEAVLLLRLEAGVALYDVRSRKEKIVVDERKSGPLAMDKGIVFVGPYHVMRGRVSLLD